MVPSARAADDFVEYADAFFAPTVPADGCSLWYNGGRPGARIRGICLAVPLTSPPYAASCDGRIGEYEYLSDSGTLFAWYFGNGRTRKEQIPHADIPSYLKLPDDVDVRDMHKSWRDLP